MKIPSEPGTGMYVCMLVVTGDTCTRTVSSNNEVEQSSLSTIQPLATSHSTCVEAIHHVPYLTVMICPPSSVISFIWAIKMAATASYSAVPSILMVAPMGSTKRVTRLSIFRFSSRQRKVTGNVPALRQNGHTR